MSGGPAFNYNHVEPLVFGGTRGGSLDFESARVAVLPVPLERTTSYVPGTRYGPRAILHASSRLELWDEETGADVHGIGIYTMPEMELPFADMAPALDEIGRAAAALVDAGKFLVMLGGEHSITPPAVGAVAARFPNLSVLQIDAHADLRVSYLGSPVSHACAMRRTLEHAPCVQVGIRSISPDEARQVSSLPTRIFYDVNMRNDPDWIDRAVGALTENVYLTIDCDGIDPAIMPAVGTPEPGGLSWEETLTLVRTAITRRSVVACDLVELCPLPSLPAPNFLCAKLIYKILTYKFAL
jgi:agmatinase